MIEKCSPHPSKEIIEKRERETTSPAACARVHVRAKQIVAHCQLYPRMYHRKMTEEWAADWVQTMAGLGWEKGNGDVLRGCWRYMHGCFKACNFGEVLYSQAVGGDRRAPRDDRRPDRPNWKHADGWMPTEKEEGDGPDPF